PVEKYLRAKKHDISTISHKNPKFRMDKSIRF
ncbi:MAG: hypothetical protein ACI8W1_003106, partial [Candidatus Azotimanducaceae bacterium]